MYYCINGGGAGMKGEGLLNLPHLSEIPEQQSFFSQQSNEVMREGRL